MFSWLLTVYTFIRLSGIFILVRDHSVIFSIFSVKAHSMVSIIKINVIVSRITRTQICNAAHRKGDFAYEGKFEFNINLLDQNLQNDILLNFY